MTLNGIYAAYALTVIGMCIGIALLTAIYMQAWEWTMGPCLVMNRSWMAHVTHLIHDGTQHVCVAQRAIGQQQLEWIRYQLYTWLTWLGSTMWMWYQHENRGGAHVVAKQHQNGCTPPMPGPGKADAEPEDPDPSGPGALPYCDRNSSNRSMSPSDLLGRNDGAERSVTPAAIDLAPGPVDNAGMPGPMLDALDAALDAPKGGSDNDA